MGDNTNEARHKLERLADRITVVLRAAGLSREDTIAAFDKAFGATDENDSFRPQSAHVDPHYARAMGAMLSIWRSTQTYLDDEGQYLHLPRLGPEPSLQSLFKAWAEKEPRIADRLDEETLLQMFTESNVLTQSQDNFVPTQSWFQVAEDRYVLSLALIDYIAQYAGAVSSSAHKDQLTQPYFLSHVNRFPNRLLPVLQSMVREQGMQSLETFDAFLESENLPPDTDEAHSHAGVGLFMFFEDTET